MRRSKDYRDLIVWQKAMGLARSAYTLTAGFPKSESFGLAAQIRRAAVSIPSNIAEGHGRLTDLQFRHFPGNTRGSLSEIQTEIELAGDPCYVERQLVQSLLDHGFEVARLINGLVVSLNRGKVGSNSADNANSASSAQKGPN